MTLRTKGVDSTNVPLMHHIDFNFRSNKERTSAYMHVRDGRGFSYCLNFTGCTTFLPLRQEFFISPASVDHQIDTVDHQILLQRLFISFGLSGNILGWLTSFLQDRSFMVAHGSTRSRWVPAPFGLPKAPFSVPYFTSFSLPIWDLCLRLGLSSVSRMATICRLTSTARRARPYVR